MQSNVEFCPSRLILDMKKNEKRNLFILYQYISLAFSKKLQYTQNVGIRFDFFLAFFVCDFLIISQIRKKCE